ncbi:MAG: response regulator [Myxococcales bacterium]|nr:response regulator [Myxococcales bacterium]
MMDDPCKRIVLVVDDDEDIRESVSYALADEGYDVVTAKDGREAITILRSTPRPCVVLLDLMMPVMTGWQVVEWVRADRTLSDLPVVVVSAVAATAPAAATCVLQKPVALDPLLEAIARHCPHAS